jgi:hypothetical protein
MELATGPDVVEEREKFPVGLLYTGAVVTDRVHAAILESVRHMQSLNFLLGVFLTWQVIFIH